MRNNLDGTFQTLAVDHINNNGQPGSQPAGYHTIIHEVPQTNVNTVTGYNQVFSGVPGTLVINGGTTPAVPPGGDQQLYALTGGGKSAQLTGYNTAATPGGYCWSGGILFQWGVFAMSTPSLSVTFPIQFPNSVFSVVLTNTTGFANDAIGLHVNPPTTGFTAVRSGSGNLNYYFMAIGN
jgi:hypothetical protein